MTAAVCPIHDMLIGSGCLGYPPAVWWAFFTACLLVGTWALWMLRVDGEL